MATLRRTGSAVNSVNSSCYSSNATIISDKIPSYLLNAFHLAFAIIGIYVFFLAWAILQEKITTTSYDGDLFTFFIFMNGMQALIAAMTAFVFLYIFQDEHLPLSPPLMMSFIKAALSNVIASSFGYQGLFYVNSYLVLTLVKSSKLLPIIMIQTLVYRTRYPVYKYIAVITISTGVSAFMLLQPSRESDDSSIPRNLWLGLFLIFINLLLDGYTNAVQDLTFRTYHLVSPRHMMLWINILSCLFTVVYLLLPLTTELTDAVSFCLRHPECFFDVLMFGVMGSLGQMFVFFTINRFGAITLVTATVTRKMFTVILSVLWFSHPTNISMWVSVSFVFSGIVLDLYMSQRKKYPIIKSATSATKFQLNISENTVSDVYSTTGKTNRINLVSKETSL